ncbi:MAG TPA: MFS transporter [Solirubrobacterales bacterium]|jgi:predicted MFS family arabinose efflux permease|nr:MFS transporter [Solirubrobacterales bacterium]
MSAWAATAPRSIGAPRVKPWLLVAASTAMLAWGGNHFTPLLLMYRQVDGYSSVEVDLFLAFYILGLVPGFLVGGPLADRYGRKRVMTVGIATGVVGSIVLAAGASSPYWLCVGRLIVGLSVAVAMVAGTSWIEELSREPYESGAGTAGARRGSLALTAGFGIGAGVSGALAQWAPAPTVLPYVVQVGLLLAAAVALAWAPETRPALAGAQAGSLGTTLRGLAADLRIPAEKRGRFFRVVAPSAPWVFGALAIAYVITPALIGSKVGGDRVAFATLLTVVALGTGALTQPLVHRLAVITGGRQLVLGLGLTFLAAALCAVEAAVLSPELAVVIAIVAGLGYGISIVSGLIEVQRMAGPDDLAGLTGIYCSLTYVGFLMPVALAALASSTSYVTLLIVVALLCLGCAVTAGWNLRSARRAAEPDPALA